MFIKVRRYQAIQCLNPSLGFEANLISSVYTVSIRAIMIEEAEVGLRRIRVLEELKNFIFMHYNLISHCCHGVCMALWHVSLRVF